MFPKIIIGDLVIPTFALCAAVGIVAFLMTTMIRLHLRGKLAKEGRYIIPKLFIALGFAFIGAVFLDALLKIPQNGGFAFSGMTFYGGLICGVAALAPMVGLCRRNTDLSLTEWLNLLTVPFLLFHFFGRLGCFFGGCCYGRATDSIFGLAFPDNPDAGIYHNGEKVLPTQLYEAIGLAVLAVVLSLVRKREFVVYCYAYPVLRFLIEFLRGDNRGAFFGVFSPSQLISLAIVVGATAYLVARFAIGKKRKNGGTKT